MTNIATDDILKKFLISFRENKTWHFMGIVCKADDSNEMARLIFSGKKGENFRMSSASIVIGTLRVKY